MPGYIPENIIEEIQSRCDIAEVISGYIPLKRAGRNFKANCPFHQEKTPSFIVNPSKQIYHCFGCGAGGDVFSFVIKYENIDFPEAVKLLAHKAGVIIPEYDQKLKKEASLANQIYKINESAVDYYQQNLYKSSAAKVREYLASRGITDETIKTFKIGFAPNLWNGLLTFAQQKGHDAQLLAQAGLVMQHEDGTRFYDRFRNRIIIPIFDAKDKVIGFGGRSLPPAGTGQQTTKEENSFPKYINSPETVLYHKSKILYGLNFSKEAIRQSDLVVIVEGYMDLIVPYQDGIKNIVASCGTSLTEEQIRLLKRFTNNMVIVYDPDAAGENAASRSLEMFLDEDVNIRVARLPEGYDPDSYVRKSGADSFRALVENAESIFDYKLSLLLKRYGDKTLNAKVLVINQMLPTIAKVRNAIIKSDYIKRLSERLSVDEEALRIELKNTKNNRTATYSQGPTTIHTEYKASPAEKLLVGLMMEENFFIDKAMVQLHDEHFCDPMTRRIANALFEWYQHKKDISAGRLINHFNDETVSKFISEVVSCLDEVSDREKCFQDCITKLKKDHVKNRLVDLQNKIKEAENTGDNENMSKLLTQYNSLIRNSQ